MLIDVYMNGPRGWYRNQDTDAVVANSGIPGCVSPGPPGCIRAVDCPVATCFARRTFLLLKVMLDPNAPASSRIRAADSVLDHAAKAIERN
jgi:hypothetical protein